MDATNWYGAGLSDNHVGPKSTVSGLSPNMQIQLTYSGTPSTVNSFYFRGRLQDFSYFQSTYDVLCSGTADEIHFFFGGQRVPNNGFDGTSEAFLVANDIYLGRHNTGLTTNFPGNQRIAATLHSGRNSAFQDVAYDSNTGSWITMTVTYTRGISSFTVSVSAQGVPLLSTVVTGGNAWIENTSGDYWGIGAYCGALTANFYFRNLRVVGTPQNPPCYICTAGSYSSEAGIGILFFL